MLICKMAQNKLCLLCKIINMFKTMLLLFLSDCDCDPAGTVTEICDKTSGICLCGESYAGPRCDRCASGSFNFPYCAGELSSL